MTGDQVAALAQVLSERASGSDNGDAMSFLLAVPYAEAEHLVEWATSMTYQRLQKAPATVDQTMAGIALGVMAGVELGVAAERVRLGSS